MEEQEDDDYDGEYGKEEDCTCLYSSFFPLTVMKLNQSYQFIGTHIGYNVNKT